MLPRSTRRTDCPFGVGSALRIVTPSPENVDPGGESTEALTLSVTDHLQGGVMTYEGQRPVEPTSDVATQRRRLSGGAIASLSGVGVLLVFMIQNTEHVTVDFLFWSFTWPLWLLILVAAVVGAFVWFGLGVLRRHGRRTTRREARRD